MLRFLRPLILLSLLAPLLGHAVTLGEARVKSFLNQPLDAEITLIGLAPGEHADLRLRLANQKHFDRLGIVFDHFLNQMRFDVVQDGATWVVRVRTDEPVIEPFLDFPVQMSWPGGQLIKQYTLLLDPPKPIRPARAASISRAVAPTAQQRTTESASLPGGESYGPVKNGETLWPIAQQLKPAGITTRQMAMALLRANPQAFIDGNVNKLKAGSVLTIPPRGFIEEMDAATARAEFAAQVRRWQAPVAVSPRVLEAAAAPQPAAPVAEPAVEPAPPPAAAETAATTVPSDPQLRIVTDKDADSIPPGSEQALKEQLLVTMEEIESNRITTDAIETRLARLESELERMQKLVELKDAQIEALQSEVSAREAIQQAAETSEPTLPEPTPPQLPASLDDQPQVAATVSAGGAAVTAPTPVARIEATPLAAPAAAGTAWYEQHLWVVWVVLGLLGLTALAMLLRRSPEGEMTMAELPQANREVTAAYRAQTTPAPAAMQQAADDFRDLAREPSPPPAEEITEAELPEIDLPSTLRDEDMDLRGGLTNSLLDTMIDESKLLTDHPTSADNEPEFTDEDIASWVAELDAEVERADKRGSGTSASANDDGLPLDDEIPSILTELDDQLSVLTDSQPIEERKEPRPADIELDPLDGSPEDDTFTMSLDLARAYLEIGDRDGARDMLQQALAGARDPEHRRQIEELLGQIG